MNAERLGETIRTLRTEKGMTQKNLADAVGVTDKAVSKWENGRSFPDIALLDSLAGALGCPLSELLGSSNLSDERTLAEKEIRASMTEAAEVRARARMLLLSAVWIAAPLLLLFATETQLTESSVFFFFLGLIFFLLFGIRFGVRCKKACTPILVAVILLGIELLVMAASYHANIDWFSNFTVPQIFRNFYGGSFYGVCFRIAQTQLPLETYYRQFPTVCLVCGMICAFLMFGFILAGAAVGRKLRGRYLGDYFG